MQELLMMCNEARWKHLDKCNPNPNPNPNSNPNPKPNIYPYPFPNQGQEYAVQSYVP